MCTLLTEFSNETTFLISRIVQVKKVNEFHPVVDSVSLQQHLLLILFILINMGPS